MSTFKRPASSQQRRPPPARQPAPLNTSAASSSTASASSQGSAPLSASNRSDLQQRTRKDAGGDGNIQVVVRCRFVDPLSSCLPQLRELTLSPRSTVDSGLSPSELNRGVTRVADVKPTRGTKVTLTDPAPALPSSSSSFNVGPSSTSLPAPSTRSWDFGDRLQEGSKEPRGNVYGPDADQGMLYHDVAKPILQQVLQGYNCTIFAYGQTGTGKTCVPPCPSPPPRRDDLAHAPSGPTRRYTMEGDLSPYHGTFHPDAGIIPRTLHSLFDRLAESKSEFSVRCSFIELYNEELRDLNARDEGDSAPSSASASGTTSPDPPVGGAPPRGGLRIYDETKNGATGVTIQGLEETFIQNAEEGLRVLRRGSERRQIAATNCNERSSAEMPTGFMRCESSRSHSIFTITVHLRDATSSASSEVLKVGKLNLVDLAGSENVGRSGAVHGRAREAGMINASLLALGRVITTLCENNGAGRKGHISYRESKLTRLLQDSLGGRTKTTIIATISPVSYEETASTLTYALQAKSIQNRPEVNQRVSRNVLLNQFATEIERLKADLNAAREQSGIYVSQETWDELEAGRLSFDETQRKLEISESQLQTTRDQFEQNFRLLSTREEQLRRASDELAVTKNELAATRAELEEVSLRAREQEALRDAFESSREGWKDEAGRALDDVDGLRAKLARKTEVERANLAMLSDAATSVAARTSSITLSTSQLQTAQSSFLASLSSQLDAFSSRQRQHLDETSAVIEEHLGAFAGKIAELARATKGQGNGAEGYRELVERTCEGMWRKIERRAGDVEREQRALGKELKMQLRRHLDEATALLERLVAPVQKLHAECGPRLEHDQRLLTTAAARDFAALQNENAHLKRILHTLESSFASEQSRLAAEESAILARVQAELAAASARRIESLGATCERVRSEVGGLGRSLEDAAGRRREAWDGLEQGNTAVRDGLDRVLERCEAAKSEGEQARSILVSSVEAIRQTNEQQSASAATAREEQLAGLRGAASFVHEASSSFHFDNAVSHRQIRRSLFALVRHVGDSAATWQYSSEGAHQDIEATASMALDAIDNYAGVSTRCVSAIDEHTSSLSSSLEQDLNRRVRHDLSTGSTPKPRARPHDRLFPTIDLDAPDRPAVLEALLRLRSADLAAAAAADELRQVELIADHPSRGRSSASSMARSPSLESVVPATQQPTVVSAVPPLATSVAPPPLPVVPAGKSELRKSKAHVLGERDPNVVASQRRALVGKRLNKMGAK
ncbi:SPOSA6832_03400, partial [Sporobolomyces salmonicolor]